MTRELRTPAEVRSACGNDDLVMWAAQGLRAGARAWAAGGAVVAGCPRISRRDRLVVWGRPGDAAPLVRHALAELGPSYRPLGEAGLIRQVAGAVEELRAGPCFSWMSLTGLRHDGGGDGVGWLEGADAEIAALLAADAPDAYAVPGDAGVLRWAGLRDGDRLAAVAADAWSAPDVGLLAGVATGSAYRGRGLAERVCRWVSGRLIDTYGRAALMVDDDNPAAIRVYERIGYRRRPVMTSRVTA
ncbi:FR47-like protein [Nonomuraea coxensis DSM 45129]|uniref:FR47-like protein n=1 Tax=Nonomuraea coxensis DSM 45129 TaxID=1122611 RepID=A0ABX8U5J1_9ACTN|nr:GNAT family N-acetyltransferase [Nonomuraea coxensis]QYC41923.1 FR47-like protein [Nonomuraea coxensis DSM 45129]